MKRAIRLLAAVTAIAVTTGGGIHAAKAEFPDKPIKMLVGFGAGGGTDRYARNIANFLQDKLNTPFVVVNKPGAAGMVAAKEMKDADADGYTLLTAGPGNFITKSVTDGNDAKVFPLKEFRALGGIGELVTSIMVPVDSPYKSAKDLVDFAKANPGELRWSHSGRASFHTIGVFVMVRRIYTQTRAKSAPTGINADQS